MSEDTPGCTVAPALEEIYCVPLERPIGRELFTVMASLLAHVLSVDREAENQP
jgi:hypothetical protein